MHDLSPSKKPHALRLACCQAWPQDSKQNFLQKSADMHLESTGLNRPLREAGYVKRSPTKTSKAELSGLCMLEHSAKFWHGLCSFVPPLESTFAAISSKQYAATARKQHTKSRRGRGQAPSREELSLAHERPEFFPQWFPEMKTVMRLRRFAKATAAFNGIVPFAWQGQRNMEDSLGKFLPKKLRHGQSHWQSCHMERSDMNPRKAREIG